MHLTHLLLWATLVIPALALAAEGIALTAAERAYIQSKPVIHMCVDPDWAPFERLDAQGQHTGIAADLIKLVAQRTGLHIEPLQVRTWEESLAASKAGRCQIMSFLNKSPERESWLNFTQPIFVDPNVLITREEHPYIADLSAITGQSITLPKGTMVAERLGAEFPSLRLLLTDDEKDAIALVSDRKADMTLRSLIVAAYTIKKEGLFNLKIAGHVPSYTNELRVGVIKGEPELLAIVSKGIQTITPQEREAISNKHAAILVQHGLDQRLLGQVLVAAFALVLIAVFWHRKLRQLDRERAALAEARVEQALESQREQSQLVALLSHEVRTGLSMIEGAAGSLQILIAPKDEASHLRIERIRAGVRRILDLTEQFLTKDRLENGALKPALRSVDVTVIWQATLAEIDPADRVVFECKGDVQVQADADLLQVAFRNLLINALRYSPSDAKVSVSVEGLSKQVRFCVKDQGPGIPWDEQDKIFASYTRGMGTQDKPGSGLGLHLVRRVTELHQGSVELTSVPGEGACFTMTLPR